MKGLAKYVALVAACSLSVPVTVHGVDYPTKPVRIMVPFSAGGGTDLLARSIAQDLGEIWRQPVIVENRGGDGGKIGAAYAAKATPDGYTILFGSPTVITVAPALYQNLSYNPMKDLVPVIRIAFTPQVLLTHLSVPVKSVKELVQMAKEKPGVMLSSNSGVGSVAYMAMALFESTAKIKLNNIPYKGAGPALAALLGGQVNATFNIVNTTLPQYRAGKVNALGISSLSRLDLMPKVPTIAESGYPGFETSTWYGLFVPTGTPDSVVRQVHRDMNQLLKTPMMHELLNSTGFVPVGSTPEQFRTRLKAELTTWRQLVQENNIKVD